MPKKRSELSGCEDIRSASVKEITRAKGLPLDPAVRTRLEKRFNRKFDFVRVHCDEQASRSARLLNARAYTIGSHIVFAKGHYDPETPAGQWLLAHELSHIVQQTEGSEPFPTNTLMPGELESAADRAADLVSSGATIPRNFRFGTAPAGFPQFHIVPGNPEHQPCYGLAAVADPATVLLAHQILEYHYTTTEGQESAQEKAIFFGTTWANPQVPEGAPNQAFARALLDRMLQLPIDERPNIIDFHLRDAYFFVWSSPAGATAATRVINRFHAIVNSLEQRFNEGNWNSATSYWFPNHALQMTFNPYGLFVCTQETYHAPPRGLILYDIRTRTRQRQRRLAVSFELQTADEVMAEFFPSLKAGLPHAVKYFDPDDRNFVFIVPEDFYYEYYKEMKTNKIWKFNVVRPSYNLPAGQEALKNLGRGLQELMILGAVVGVVVVGSIVFVAALPAAMAGAGAVASTGAAMGASLPISTIVVPLDLAATVAASGTATATAAMAGGGVTAALWTVSMAPTVKTVAAMAGVLLIIGNTGTANAGTNVSAQPRMRSSQNPGLRNVSAFRAVAVTDFKPSGSIQVAHSYGPPQDFSHSPETAKGKFDVGTKVLFDGVPHIIIGGFSVS